MSWSKKCTRTLSLVIGFKTSSFTFPCLGKWLWVNKLIFLPTVNTQLGANVSGGLLVVNELSEMFCSKDTPLHFEPDEVSGSGFRVAFHSASYSNQSWRWTLHGSPWLNHRRWDKKPVGQTIWRWQKAVLATVVTWAFIESPNDAYQLIPLGWELHALPWSSGQTEQRKYQLYVVLISPSGPAGYGSGLCPGILSTSQWCPTSPPVHPHF